MKQLSGTDSFFVSSERDNVYNHVASLGIYDPSTAPGGRVRFKDILRYYGRRMHLSGIFRRRLVSTPYGIDRPYWIDDQEIDLEFHIRHIALPEPGDWRQLMIQVARLHSRPLDRSRPLWEVYVIEGLHRIPGLPAGSFALFTKVHHAAIDGQAGAELLKAVHSLSADPDPDEAESQAPHAERDPTTVELVSGAAANAVGRVVGAATFYARTAQRLANVGFGEAARRLRDDGSDAESALPQLVRAPATRFNRRVSANRVVDALGLPIASIKPIRAHVDGTTINDIFLATVGGALRKYLDAKGELPPRTLTALMPISIRQPQHGADGGNQVGGVPVKLHTDVADPIDRLRAVQADAAAAKRGSEALGHDFLQGALDHLPNAVSERLMRWLIYPQLNVTVSNVRGPDVPLFVAGARLVHFYPVSIATDYVGLNITGFSYNGVLWISAVACRNMLPDPAFFTQCLQSSFDELAAAAQASTQPSDRTAKAGVRRRTSQRARPAARPRRKKLEASLSPDETPTVGTQG